ncbi:helix-turn-helix transcriptional regulator [Carnobacterium maltaromaticum]|uniref:helix-turn-helix transcriptional regulator n=2 Tax=Carnobacterium TaxID=2747 RepID=UPI0039BE4D3F
MKDLGYNEENGIYQCEFCRFTTEKGQVYPIEDENKFFEAWRFMEHHIKTEHHSVLMALLAKGKEEHGLSQQQVELISLFYQGKKDSDIQKELGIASLSTLRNHRFNLRKKERQAQNFLRIMAFLKDDEQQKNPTKFTKEQDYFTHNGQLIRYPKGKK